MSGRVPGRQHGVTQQQVGAPTGIVQIQEDVALAPLTTMGVGGAARYYTRVKTEEELRSAIRWAYAKGVACFFLGGGSNLLVSDSGFSGLVLHIGLPGIERESVGGLVRVTVGAGVEWDELVSWAVNASLQGIECLSGIPGCVGATPVQNVGAYGQEVADTIEAVEVLDLESLQSAWLSAVECGFAYRQSRFKKADCGRFVVTRVAFLLRPDASSSIRYPELARYIEEQFSGRKPALAHVREAVLAIRRKKSMVVDPDDVNSHSCGSFFTNPIVPTPLVQQVEEAARRIGALSEDEKLPAYDAGEGRSKLSAAWLIERAGLKRGMRYGCVGLSQKHVLAIVNYGGGQASEVQELKSLIQARVRDVFGVQLEPEPVSLGFSPAS